MTTSTPQEFWTQTALRERVSQLLVATSIFPDWAVEFFDQLLRLISYSTKTDVSRFSYFGCSHGVWFISMKHNNKFDHYFPSLIFVYFRKMLVD